MSELNISKLKESLRGEVQNDEATLQFYSRDASLFEIKPALVVFPKDETDLKNLVKFASETKKQGENIALTPRLAGTDMSGGTLTDSIVVEMMRHFNRIKEIGSDFAVTEPGVYYRDFESETLKHDLLLPSYPASREICSVGGMVANNSGGEKTLTYGKTERYVETIKMILSDGSEAVFKALEPEELKAKKNSPTFEGEIYRKMYKLIIDNYDLLLKAKPRVSKNSSGYALWNVIDPDSKKFDLTQIITGSQGTLGIITEIRLKLIKPKPCSRLLVIFLKNMDKLATLVEKILIHKPESFESYDDHTFKLALRLMPQLAKRLKGNFLSLAFSFLPELWLVLTGGVPKLVLLAEFTGDSNEEAEAKAKQAQNELKNFPDVALKITRSDRESMKYWTIRRESFNLLRHKLKNLRTAPFIDDLIIRPDQLSEFMPKLYEILNKYDIIYTIAGHAGDANFHIIPLMDLGKPESKTIIKNLAEQVYRLVFEFGGSMSGEHNDGLVRSPYLEMMYGKEVCRLFEETKKIFDPQNIFNPGKKVGSTLEYAEKHIAFH